MNWLHKLFHPHCEHCLLEEQESKHCRTCEVLEMELAHLRGANQDLLLRLLNPIKQTEPEVLDTRNLKPIMPQGRELPWRVKQQMLEREDRDRAQKEKLAGRPDIVEKLESELGVVPGESL